MANNDSMFVDVCGAELQIGDKVATNYAQLFRIGVVVGFTAKKVIVRFDFGCDPGVIDPYSEPTTSQEDAKIFAWKIAKCFNQNCEVDDYYKYNGTSKLMHY